ncbi:MAG TPA: hypothetical protein VKD08_06375 [Ignavibacteriaceae bacterium]|jgi:hypothetical protein|nr:hypothetical protein [Ignavibacteriaceae bacterium]
MEEIYLIAGAILVYLFYNLFVPSHYRRSHFLDKTDLRSLFRN